MNASERIAGIAAPLLLDDVDTDQIIAVEDMVSSMDASFGTRLFARWRFDESGARRSDFVLNQPPFDKASILIAGANFGCGSSREHAVWALKEFGIRCILAASFADIFHDNCRRQGIVALSFRRDDLERLADHVRAVDPHLVIDLTARSIGSRGLRDSVPIPDEPSNDAWVTEDEIAQTQRFESDIARWEDADRLARPWISPVRLGERR